MYRRQFLPRSRGTRIASQCWYPLRKYKTKTIVKLLIITRPPWTTTIRVLRASSRKRTFRWSSHAQASWGLAFWRVSREVILSQIHPRESQRRKTWSCWWRSSMLRKPLTTVTSNSRFKSTRLRTNSYLKQGSGPSLIGKTKPLIAWRSRDSSWVKCSLKRWPKTTSRGKTWSTTATASSRSTKTTSWRNSPS